MILLLLISAAAVACGSNPGTEPDRETPPASTMAPATQIPALFTTPQPGNENNEITLRKRELATAEAQSGESTPPAPTATNEASPQETDQITPNPEEDEPYSGPQIHPNNSHEPFDPVNGPTGTEEELVAEIDFVIQVHINHLWKPVPDYEANRLLQGRLSEDNRRACKPREMRGDLAREYRHVHRAEGRDNREYADLAEEITYSIHVLEIDGRTAEARLEFHSGDKTYHQEYPTPMDRWIYVEGISNEANRWVMEPEDIATRREC